MFIISLQLRAFQYLQRGKDIPSDLAILLGPAAYYQDRKTKLIQEPKKDNEATENEVEVKEEDESTMSDGKEVNDVKMDTNESALIIQPSALVGMEKAEEINDYEARCEVFEVLTDMLYHVARGSGYPSMMESAHAKRSQGYRSAITRSMAKHEKRVGEYDVVLPRGPHGMYGTSVCNYLFNPIYT